jgi:hypothetical protein
MKKAGVLFLLLAFFACGNGEPDGNVPKPGSDPVSGAAPRAAGRGEAVQREAVLTRNNGWVTGIPGIAGNAFPVLAGEYRLEGLEPPKTGDGEKPAAGFSVRVSREPVLFSGDWQRRPGTGNNVVLQRFLGNDLLAAAVLGAEPVQGSWTVVFEFPGGIAGTSLENAAFNRLIEAWSSRFLYFASLVKTPGDVSLPAVVVF